METQDGEVLNLEQATGDPPQFPPTGKTSGKFGLTEHGAELLKNSKVFEMPKVIEKKQPVKKTARFKEGVAAGETSSQVLERVHMLYP